MPTKQKPTPIKKKPPTRLKSSGPITITLNLMVTFTDTLNFLDAAQDLVDKANEHGVVEVASLDVPKGAHVSLI